jgi:hypothetical protein
VNYSRVSKISVLSLPSSWSFATVDTHALCRTSRNQRKSHLSLHHMRKEAKSSVRASVEHVTPIILKMRHFVLNAGRSIDDRSGTGRLSNMAHYPPDGDAFHPQDLNALLVATIRMYQRSFSPFFTIAFLGAMPLLLLMIPTTTWQLALVLNLPAIAIGYLAQGAITYAVTKRYIGENIFVTDCYARAWDKGFLLVIGGMLFTGVMLILGLISIMLLGITLPIFFYILVSWFFFVQVIMLEGKDPPAALERSRRLVSGRWLRTCPIIVIALIAELTLFGTQLIVLSLVSEMFAVIYHIIVWSLLSPVIVILTTLTYFDLRIRKEDYTRNQITAEL